MHPLLPSVTARCRYRPVPVIPDGPLSELVPVGPGRREPLPEDVPDPVVPVLPDVPPEPLRRRHSSSVIGSVPMLPVPVVPVPDVPVPVVPVPVVPELPLP